MITKDMFEEIIGSTDGFKERMFKRFLNKLEKKDNSNSLELIIFSVRWLFNLTCCLFGYLRYQIHELNSLTSRVEILEKENEVLNLKLKRNETKT